MIRILLSKRFGNNNKPLCDAFYNIPSSITLRKTAFGYGKKSDFTSGKMKTPAPNTYEIRNEANIKFKKGSGWVFGESRNKMKGNGIF